MHFQYRFLSILSQKLNHFPITAMSKTWTFCHKCVSNSVFITPQFVVVGEINNLVFLLQI